MTYFDKLLEKMGGDAKEAAKAAIDNCTNDFFANTPGLFDEPRCDKGLDCGDCWFSEVEE